MIANANHPFLLPAGLPALDADARTQGEALLARLLAEIDAVDGWISFYRYMDLCLYAPGLGYYSAGSRKLGRQGDFVTAPELSPLFGGCIARQVAQVLDRLEGDGDIISRSNGTHRLDRRAAGQRVARRAAG